MNRPRAFTLIEVTLALALALVLLALVIVRLPWGGPRQAVIQAANRLGCQVRLCRERAREEEALYALRLNLASGSYSVVRPADRSEDALAKAAILYSAALAAPLSFKQVLMQGSPQPNPVLFFDARGVLPETSIDIATQQVGVLLRIDPVLNEVVYVEH
jgi:prepilin-type N-terminal cleavage/methylation domain-containing protein